MGYELTTTKSRKSAHENDDDEASRIHYEEIDINAESRGLLVAHDGVSEDEDDAVHVVEMDYTYLIKSFMVLVAVVTFFFAVGLKIGGSDVLTIPALLVGKNDASVISTENDAPDPIKQRRVDNYINGTALILSTHITHHAGTAVCAQMKTFGPSPDFACMGPGKPNGDEHPWPPGLDTNTMRKSWPYNNTAKYVQKLRPYFHFFSQEHRHYGNLHRTNWEHENLVSLIVMRHPIERFLAGGKCGKLHGTLSGDPTNETQAMYWEYANEKCADNYALRVLTDDPNCVNGANTSQECLNGAKRLLSRFNFILDQACLDESMVALGKALKLNISLPTSKNRLHHIHPTSIPERLKNDTLFEFLRYRFRRDIELYEWSKTKSIVKCGIDSKNPHRPFQQ